MHRFGNVDSFISSADLRLEELRDTKDNSHAAVFRRCFQKSSGAGKGCLKILLNEGESVYGGDKKEPPAGLCDGNARGIKKLKYHQFV